MAEKLRIQRLKFKAGSIPGIDGLEVAVPNVTILVGPNNSGKSQTLRELEAWCLGKDSEAKIVDQIDLVWPDAIEDLMSMLLVHKAEPPPSHLPKPGHFWISRPTVRLGEDVLHQEVSEASLVDWFRRPNDQPLRQIFVRSYTLRLDGRTRFDLVEPKDTGALEGHPANHLWALFVNDEGREKVRKFTEEAFAKHFVIDPTGMRNFRVRLASRRPRTKAEEQGLDQEARTYHQSAPLISTLGDGVRTSVGLVSAVMSLAHRIILIDEPEAFLHPTLARRVGRVLTEIARERDASLVVATHSADFLMGCIQATPEIRIVRLTFADNSPTARSIDPTKVGTLMNDPLLRSTNALRALFHRGVVVTEADADRAFYEEINYRLLQINLGMEDALFMNAQNWQTIPRIIAPLRMLGVPAVAIFDFDVLMDQSFHHIWPLLHSDAIELENLQLQRRNIKALMDELGRANCKASGVNSFDENDRSSVEGFLSKMAEYGVFFVPVGELECWLKNLGIARTNNKPKWLTDIFNRMGSDPLANEYVKPANDDVWEFISEIENWIGNPLRKGIPT